MSKAKTMKHQRMRPERRMTKKQIEAFYRDLRPGAQFFVWWDQLDQWKIVDGKFYATAHGRQAEAKVIESIVRQEPMRVWTNDEHKRHDDLINEYGEAFEEPFIGVYALELLDPGKPPPTALNLDGFDDPIVFEDEIITVGCMIIPRTAAQTIFEHMATWLGYELS
jgi:hypothetical protein